MQSIIDNLDLILFVLLIAGPILAYQHWEINNSPSFVAQEPESVIKVDEKDNR